MLRNWMKRGALSALALAMTVAGCENLTDVAAPELSPRAPLHTVIAKENNCSVGVKLTVTVSTDGGVLTLCKHKLTIPTGAVAGPTVFVMTKLDSEIKVDLSATSVGSLVLNDAGAKGFLKPLTLTLNYQDATALPADLSKLSVYWLKDDGSIVKQTSTVNTVHQTVIAYPTHFSRYAIGWPD